MQVAATFQNPMTKTAVEVLIFATFLTLLTCVNSATFQGWISLLNHPDPLSLSHCTLFFQAHVVCVNRRWVLADTWSKVCCSQTCLTSHSKDEPVGRLEWISNSSWKFIAQPDGLHNWPHVVVSAVFSKRECSYTWGKFLQAVTEKERDKLKKGGKKPLSHLASCLKKKGSGWRHFLHCHSQIAETCAIFNRKVYSVSNPESGSTPVLQGNPSVHYCVRLRKEEKGGSIGGKEICLFVWEGLSKKAIL